MGSSLRRRIIRLASEKPELRKDLLPLLKREGGGRDKFPAAEAYRGHLENGELTEDEIAGNRHILRYRKTFEDISSSLRNWFSSRDLQTEWEGVQKAVGRFLDTIAVPTVLLSEKRKQTFLHFPR